MLILLIRVQHTSHDAFVSIPLPFMNLVCGCGKWPSWKLIALRIMQSLHPAALVARGQPIVLLQETQGGDYSDALYGPGTDVRV